MVDKGQRFLGFTTRPFFLCQHSEWIGKRVRFSHNQIKTQTKSEENLSKKM